MFVVKFVWRLLWKAVVIVLIIAAMSVISSPALTNQIAMMQMENSDMLYILVSNFTNLKTVFDIIGVGVIVGMAISIESDIRKFAKSIKSENNEKEN